MQEHVQARVHEDKTQPALTRAQRMGGIGNEYRNACMDAPADADSSKHDLLTCAPTIGFAHPNSKADEKNTSCERPDGHAHGRMPMRICTNASLAHAKEREL